MKHYLSTANEKLARSGIASWGIPAYKSADGFLTCPGALSCIQGCYARNGRFVMPNVKAAQERRLQLARSPEFVATIDAEIKARSIKKIRIHDSGDFFSRAYLLAWHEIARRNPKTLFYAYTKMIPLVAANPGPGNLVIIQSTGGRWDMQIDQTKRHAVVFPDRSSLKAAGYADASHLDSRAFGKSHKVGLVYHGAKSKTWTTQALH